MWWDIGARQRLEVAHSVSEMRMASILLTVNYKLSKAVVGSRDKPLSSKRRMAPNFTDKRLFVPKKLPQIALYDTVYFTVANKWQIQATFAKIR